MKLTDVLRRWLQRWKERHELIQMTEQQLRDVGLDRDLARTEAAKIFWARMQ